MSVKSDSSDNQATATTTAALSRPRLCHLRKWSYFQGYGFNLHAEKTRNGQFIGKVDANSPAEAAGLKEKDRIIEVNYVNISNENHQQVVKRIRNGLEIDGKIIENEVVLLVVDEEADNYYKKLNQVIKSNMDDVLYLETPPEDSNTTNTSAKSNSPAPERVVSTDSTDNSSNQKVNEMQYENVDSNNNNQANNSQNNTRASSNASTPASNAKFNANHYENNSKVSPPNTPLSTKSNNSSASKSNTKTAASIVPPSPTITTTSNHSNNKSSSSSTTTNNNNTLNNSNNINNNDTSGDIFNAGKISSNDRTPPAKPPRLSITEIERLNVDNIDSISNYSGNNNNKIDRYVSSSSLVDQDFHDKGINAVREMLDSTNHLNSKKDKDYHHHHFDFSHLNPLKLSKKLSKETKGSHNNLHNEINNNNNNNYNSYQNAGYSYLSDYKSEDNNNNNNNSNFYNEETSIKSNKKFNSSEPIMSSILGGQNTASYGKKSNNNSNNNVRSLYNEEQNQRNYSPNEKKLNEFFKMSASEFKNYLKNKQKADPRTEPVDMKQKYQLFQNM